MAVVTVPQQGKRIEGEAEIASFLKPYGIRYERWPLEERCSPDASNEEILAAYSPEIEKLKAGASGSEGMPSGFRTLELYGQLGGQNVPLSQVLTEQGGGFAVVPGGVVLGGESPGEGFGYGGTPGRWTEASGGQPPTAFGQDAQLGIVGFDGARAWPVPASTLAQIFGTNWRGSLS